MVNVYEECTAQERDRLRALLDHLVYREDRTEQYWQGWRIRSIAGGRANIIYRATDESNDIAVKFTLRDEQKRAQREYDALSLLRQQGVSVAPAPMLLDRTTYPRPVILFTWPEGQRSASPPANRGEWLSLIDHLVTVHTATTGATMHGMARAVLNMRSAGEGCRLVREQLALLPENRCPPALQGLVERLQATSFPGWPDPPVTLCRTDPNYLNFVRREDGWLSVNWEDSGWGDPAFDIADLLTCPAYKDVPPFRWEWVIRTYCERVDDPKAERRIRTYYQIMALWWAVRSAQDLHEIPPGLDERLAARPELWKAQARRRYEHYLELAGTLFGQA